MEATKKGKVSDYLKAAGLGILAIALFYLIQILVMMGMMFVGMFLDIIRVGGENQEASSLVSQMQSPEFLTSATAVMTAVTTLVFGIWYKLRYGRKFMETRFQSFRQYVLTRKNVLVFLLLGLSCYFIEIIIANVIAVVSPDVMELYLEGMEGIMGGNSVVVFFFTGLLAPIGEECLFRGLILKKYLKWLPVVPAILLQAVFFGIFHMNYVQGIYVLIIGTVAGYVAYRCKSVLPAIFIHFVNNTMPSVLRAVPESVQENYVLWTVIGVLALVLLIAVIKYMPGELMEVPEEPVAKEEAAE